MRFSMDVMCDHAKEEYDGVEQVPSHMNPLEIFDFTVVEGRGYAWQCPVCDVRICIRLNIEEEDQ